MAKPNNGLITETNSQYYAGSQSFTTTSNQTSFAATFNTDLVFGSYSPNTSEYDLNNFVLYTSALGLPGTFGEYTLPYTVADNIITLATGLAANSYLVIQLKSNSGGNYGNEDAFGDAVENNYGGYQYVTLKDIINNFLVAYVGAGKLILDVKRTDVVFHAKRGLQEFSYDTLKSIKSQELNIPPSLSVIIPQDFVNYVKMSWVDRLGVKHQIYPTQLTSNPYATPLQDNLGTPIQDFDESNLQGSSITEERWDTANTRLINNIASLEDYNNGLDPNNQYWDNGNFYGRAYGLDPQNANVNGWFTINEREGKISFSSDLVGKLIILEYVSDGLAYDMDTKVPKMAEEAMYLHLVYSVLATRANQPEYVVQRFKRDKSAALRNAKIRLSNIKLSEIVQVMRGKSKWIKH
ncbi:hypothetical protein N9980_01525 [bacterium]|nr:hypothetical protein [bacterium]